MRPYTLLSCAVSLDGCLDDASDRRLLLSGPEDFDRVDEVRASCDAILVGATTVRRDDPALLLRDEARRAARVARGASPDPLRVTLTASGDLEPGRRLFAGATPLVYAPPAVAPTLATRLGPGATVVAAESLTAALADLRGRGVHRLLVEGGGQVLTQFLTEGLADELHLAVAPLFVGDSRAPRFIVDGAFPPALTERLRLTEARPVGDVVLLRYALSPAAADRHWLAVAIEESRRCTPSPHAFSVGAVIVDATGREVSRGYSRENDPHLHAEESALSKVSPADLRLRSATIYSSLEPCGARASRPRPCAALISAAGIPRVVYAWREPTHFVDGHGAEQLCAAGVKVIEIADLADEVRAVNAHLGL